MNNHVMDMDISSMYAWSPLVKKQSEICKLLKIRRNGKSHKAKMFAKYRLKLIKGAWIQYDTEKDKAWTQKHISSISLSEPDTDYKFDVKFDYSAMTLAEKMEIKKCLNQTFGSST